MKTKKEKIQFILQKMSVYSYEYYLIRNKSCIQYYSRAFIVLIKFLMLLKRQFQLCQFLKQDKHCNIDYRK